jgi:2-dehydro-3-deoxyphosphooctonate aldolase (KDO 8-P synthase)
MSKITIIAGPCQHESFEHSSMIAERCKIACFNHKADYYFKASFDKANRTSLSGKRGLGLEETLHDFTKMKKDMHQLKILTDVHERDQVRQVSEVVDVIQIPAFLCRQTDLILKACKTDCIVNIKKGQFLAPWDIKGILSKCEGAKEIWITERGTCFGYNTLVNDFTGLQYMMKNYDVPIVYDVTHSVQKPGGLGESSDGDRSYIPGLARAASALGVSHFFIEVHDDPDNAPSDGPTQLNLKDFEHLVKDITEYNYNVNNTTKYTYG